MLPSQVLVTLLPPKITSN